MLLPLNSGISGFSLDGGCIWVMNGWNVNISSGFSSLFGGHNFYVFFPKFFWKFSIILVCYYIKRSLIVTLSFFKCAFCYKYPCRSFVHCIWWWLHIKCFQLDSVRLVDKALSLCICTFVHLDMVDFDVNFIIVTVDGWSYVFCAAIAAFYCMIVEDIV